MTSASQPSSLTMSVGSGHPPSSPTAGATGSPPLLRKGIPGEKKPLREKLITYYEEIFTVRERVIGILHEMVRNRGGNYGG